MTPRELRLWHWRRAMFCRAKAAWHLDSKYGRKLARSENVKADFHMGAVQVLNDLITDTTAEQDNKRTSCSHRFSAASTVCLICARPRIDLE